MTSDKINKMSEKYYSEEYLEQALTLLIKINDNIEELDASNYKKLEFLNTGIIFDEPSEAFDLFIDELLFSLIDDEYIQLINIFYDNFGPDEFGLYDYGHGPISGHAMDHALKTNNIEIIKTVLRNGYDDTEGFYFIEEISEYKNLELLKLFRKKMPNEFDIEYLKFIDKDIFLFLYNNECRIDSNFILYITKSDYNEYIIDYIMRNEDFDILNYMDLNKEEYVNIKQKIKEIKNKYTKVLEDKDVNRDIGFTILSYMFY